MPLARICRLILGLTGLSSVLQRPSFQSRINQFDAAFVTYQCSVSRQLVRFYTNAAVPINCV